jgi:toxin ParE1/3/4
MHYLEEAGPDVALGFMDALEHATAHIARHPGTGSPRYSRQLQIPGLRCWAVRKFPYLLFYIEGEKEIDVLHVLHGAMDLPEWLDA